MEEAWHYTSLDRCLSILSTKELWLTNIFQTNDEIDCDWSRRLLCSYFEPMLTSKVSNKTKRIHLADGNNIRNRVRQETQRRLDMLFNSMAGNKSKFTSYMICFSTKCDTCDNDGILSMWRGYGSDQPVAIVFNREKLYNLTLEHVVKNRLACYFDKVCYARNNEHIAERFKDSLDSLTPIFSTEDNRFLSTYFDLNVESIFHSVARLTYSVKHFGFHEENEIRLVIQLNGNAPDSKYKIFYGNSLLKSIEKIVVGPNDNNLEQKLKKGLKSLALNIKIESSEIPYRKVK